METGEIIRLSVTDANENGAGISKIDGMVIFTPGLVSGDCADVRLKEKRKNYMIGEAVSVLEKSPDRIEPVCPSAGECGGCSLCHVSYEYENLIKKNAVCAALRRSSLPYGIVSGTVFSPFRTGYRNKVTVHFDKKAGRLGLYGEDTHTVVPFAGCMLLPEKFNEIIRFLNSESRLLAECGVSDVVIKSSSDGKIIMTVGSVCDLSVLSDRIKSAFPCVTDVICSDMANTSFVLGEYGKIKMRFSSDGFRQVNDSAFVMLLSVVSRLVSEKPFKCCADLYCGSGVIGLYLAAEHPDSVFYGIEINESSIRDANYNKDVNGLDNITFFSGDAATFYEKIPHDTLPDTVIVDPPRAGLSEKMRRELISLGAERIIYVSCNPQTMARDLKDLSAAGYTAESVTPVNMFPMTRHVETVCLLSRV